MEILDRYIERLMTESTPQSPLWNMERVRTGRANKWNYVDGCVIKAITELYQITENPRYLEFADSFVDYFIEEDGSIRGFDASHQSLDDVMSSRNLFPLYYLTKKEKYRKALDTSYAMIKTQPRTESGTFWHKNIYPNQIWLDGLYMGQPLYMQYERDFNNSENCYDSYQQFLNVYEKLRDPKNGLYYHAYDESREMFWCDPVTGLSQCFWSRALGWYAMALVDTFTVMPESMTEEAANITRMFRELVDSMLKYQDKESGMWYQVVNFGGIAPNYLETSGSAIFAYAIMKGVRIGMLPEEYFAHGEKAFNGTCDKYLSEKDGQLQLGGICLVAGLGNKTHREGTFEYYMREPIVENDGKGVAPLIMAYTEILYRNKK